MSFRAGQIVIFSRGDEEVHSELDRKYEGKMATVISCGEITPITASIIQFEDGSQFVKHNKYLRKV